MSWIYEALHEAETERQRKGGETSHSRPQERLAAGTLRAAPDPPRHQGEMRAEYEQIHAALHAIPRYGRSRGVVVCSSIWGEGTSRVAAELASVCAQQNGSRVLLIDANLRHPEVHRRFHIKREPGLIDALVEGRDLPEKEICQSPIPGLFLLPAGDVGLNPTTLFESERFPALLGRLGTAYDYVIFDSAPVHSCPETLALAGQAGGVVLVVRAGAGRL